MSHLFLTGENKSWTNHQNERPLSIWMRKTWKPSRDSRRNTTSQSIGPSIFVFRDTFLRWLSGFKKMNPENDGVMIGDSLLCPDIESLKSLFNECLDSCLEKGMSPDTKIPCYSLWSVKSLLNRDVPNVSLISNRRKQIMNKSPKRKTSIYLDEKNLETIKGFKKKYNLSVNRIISLCLQRYLLEMTVWIWEYESRTQMLRNRFERDSEIRVDRHDWEESLNKWKEIDERDSEIAV